MPPQTEYCYRYPRPALTVDIVLFRTSPQGHEVLLIQRKYPPFAGQWALPGGFVDEGETLEQAAHRELLEETNLSDITLSQMGAFGDPGRDPRGWTVSVAFTGFCDQGCFARAGDDAAHVKWHPVTALPPMAFDHHHIIQVALQGWHQT